MKSFSLKQTALVLMIASLSPLLTMCASTHSGKPNVSVAPTTEKAKLSDSPSPSSVGASKAPAPPKQINVVDYSLFVLFTNDSMKTTEEHRGFAKKLRESLPAKAPLIQVRVIGYTDTMGDTKKNTLIAKKRVENIAKLLIEIGFPTDKVVIFAEGDGKSVNSPTTCPAPKNKKAGKAAKAHLECLEKNRRVIISALVQE